MDITRTYDSYQEFLDKAEHGKSVLDVSERWSRAGNNKSSSGTATYEEANRLARDGWPRGRRKVEKIREQLAGVVSQRIHRLSPAFGVAGGFPDVGRFLAGQPDCMVSFQRAEARERPRVITMDVNAVYAWKVRKDAVIRRGAAVCAVVDLIEDAGASVEVRLVFPSTATVGCHRHTYIVWVALKAAEQPLDVDRMAFALAHPATLRRIWASVAEQEEKEVIAKFSFRSGGNYSECYDIKSEADVYVPRLTKKSGQYGVDWVIGTLRKQGVEIDED